MGYEDFPSSSHICVQNSSIVRTMVVFLAKKTKHRSIVIVAFLLIHSFFTAVVGAKQRNLYLRNLAAKAQVTGNNQYSFEELCCIFS